MKKDKKQKNHFKYAKILISLFILMFVSPITVLLASFWFKSLFAYIPHVSLALVLVLKGVFLYICYLNVIKKNKRKKVE